MAVTVAIVATCLAACLAAAPPGAERRPADGDERDAEIVRHLDELLQLELLEHLDLFDPAGDDERRGRDAGAREEPPPKPPAR